MRIRLAGGPLARLMVLVPAVHAEGSGGWRDSDEDAKLTALFQEYLDAGCKTRFDARREPPFPHPYARLPKTPQGTNSSFHCSASAVTRPSSNATNACRTRRGSPTG